MIDTCLYKVFRSSVGHFTKWHIKCTLRLPSVALAFGHLCSFFSLFSPLIHYSCGGHRSQELGRPSLRSGLPSSCLLTRIPQPFIYLPSLPRLRERSSYHTPSLRSAFLGPRSLRAWSFGVRACSSADAILYDPAFVPLFGSS